MHLVSSTRKQNTQATIKPLVGSLPGLAAWLLLRWRHWQQGIRPARQRMRVIEQLALGGKRQLLLVDIGGERFLVGGGPASVDTIVRVRARARSGKTADLTPTTLGERC